MVTATFSNGFTDTYKGTRDVTAAWAIIERDTGRVVKSGHSLTREKAAKTASSNMPKVHNTAGYAISAYQKRRYRETGKLLSTSQIRAKFFAENAEHQKRYAVEIVDLG